MTNKLVVVINTLKVPKIKKILLYEMKFLVPNYSCLQNPWLGGYCPQIPVLSVLYPQLNLLNPPPWTKFLGTLLPSFVFPNFLTPQVSRYGNWTVTTSKRKWHPWHEIHYKWHKMQKKNEKRDKLYMGWEVHAFPSTLCFVNFTQKISWTVLSMVMDCSI